MSEYLGKLIECDRCGKTSFLYRTDTGIKLIECDRCGKTSFLYRTDTEIIDVYHSKEIYDQLPKGWIKHCSGIGLLCDECEDSYQKLLDEFFGK